MVYLHQYLINVCAFCNCSSTCCFPLVVSGATIRYSVKVKVFKYVNAHKGNCMPNTKKQVPKLQKASLKVTL
uniref:Uncharacterized protein n=1 Tax=Anguilla anguilla TaxID=7936 RepID=A0A0E9PCX0_ANGAN